MSAFRKWRWTNQQPKEYGHYWYRWSDAHSPQIVEVFHDAEDNIDSVRLSERADDVSFLQNYVGQWCGPIPLPTTPAHPGDEIGSESL